MSVPCRVQRRRAKGWKLPANTVCVDRSTKWGNPFVISAKLSRERAVALFRLMLGGYQCVSSKNALEQDAYVEMARRDIGELRGKNLACWCPPDQPCHADVLLEAANV